MIENVKRYRAHTSHGHDAARTIAVIYVITAVGMLVPYLKYAIWLLPLVLLLREKESDFVLFMAAQMTMLGALHAAMAFLLEVPIRLALRAMNHSLAFGWVLVGDVAGLVTAILAAFISLSAVILSLIAASRALRYVEAHVILAAPLAERVLALPRFRD